MEVADAAYAGLGAREITLSVVVATIGFFVALGALDLMKGVN